MGNRTLDAPAVAPPFGKYSHAVEVPAGQRWLCVSGQVGVTPNGVVARGAQAQCEQAFANLLAILEDAAMGLDDIVRLGVFLVDAGDVAAYRAVRDRVLDGRRPASTLLVVEALASEEWLVEIEMTAARP